MCLAYPGKIESINGEKAIIDFSGIKKESNISLVDVAVGDYVIVHAGFAIEKLNTDDAVNTIKLFEEE